MIPTVNALALVMMREAGEDASNSDLVAQYEAWIQDVYDEIGIFCDWRFNYLVESFSTVIANAIYTLTGVIDQNVTIQEISTSIPLEGRDSQWLIEHGFNLNLAGKPIFFYGTSYDSVTEKYSLKLYPVPNAIYTYQVTAYIQPRELTSLDQLPFSRDFIFALKDGVRIKNKEDDKDFVGASRIEKRFQMSLARLKARNDVNKAYTLQMEVQDISRNSENIVRLPPDHFSN